MYKRLWLCRCTSCDAVYGYSDQEISINDDGEPCRDVSGEGDEQPDFAQLYCRCGYPLEVLQQVGEW